MYWQNGRAADWRQDRGGGRQTPGLLQPGARRRRHRRCKQPAQADRSESTTSKGCLRELKVMIVLRFMRVQEKPKEQ